MSTERGDGSVTRAFPSKRAPDGEGWLCSFCETPMNRRQLDHFLAVRRCRQWNTSVEEGTTVLYHPIVDEEASRKAETRSVAWALASGEAVVMITGQSGGVSLDALEIIGRPSIRDPDNRLHVDWPQPATHS